jgi:hypothetical protein
VSSSTGRWPRYGWWRRAACAKVDPEIFDTVPAGGRPTRSSYDRQKEAKAVCLGCPVLWDCLSEFMAKEVPTYSTSGAGRHGIIGALGPSERERLYKKIRESS